MRGPVPNPFPELRTLEASESARWATEMSEARKRAKRAEKALQKVREEQGGAVLHEPAGSHVSDVPQASDASLDAVGAAAGDVWDH